MLKKNPFLLLAAVIFLFFFTTASLSLDPDFGWHLRMGWIIGQSGIPKTDPFSYTMAAFPFVDHEWLTNFLISQLYGLVGFFGLSVIFSLLTTSVLYLMFPKNKFSIENKFSLVPFFLAAGILINFAGVRTQVITWFFFALLLKILFDAKLWQKWRFFLPVMFLLWANMHAGFAAGIAVLMVVVFLRSLQLKKLLWPDYLVVISSVVATLINPYGLRLWGEVWMQVSDSGLHSEISEWIPGIFFVDFAFLFLVASTVFFSIYFFKNKSFRGARGLDPIKLVIFIALLLAAFSASRHISLWTISAAPLLGLYFQTFYFQIKKDDFARQTSQKFYQILSVSVAILFLFEAGLAIQESVSFSENNFYPSGAINYLKTHQIEGQIFSEYSWGGYLDWKLPEKKVFIDGRMPSWRWTSAPAGESNFAFQDYSRLVTGQENFNQQFEKYRISTVLWPVGDSESQNKISGLKHWYSLLVDNLFNNQKPGVPLSVQLKQNGWVEVYRDQVAVIYQKGS